MTDFRGGPNWLLVAVGTEMLLNPNSKAVPFFFLTTSFPFNLVPNKHNSWDEALMGVGEQETFLNK